MDGGNLAPPSQSGFLSALYTLLNIGIERLQKQICSNDVEILHRLVLNRCPLNRGVRMHHRFRV